MKKVAIYPLDYNIRELIYNVSMIKNFEINFISNFRLSA